VGWLVVEVGSKIVAASAVKMALSMSRPEERAFKK